MAITLILGVTSICHCKEFFQKALWSLGLNEKQVD